MCDDSFGVASDNRVCRTVESRITKCQLYLMQLISGINSWSGFKLPAHQTLDLYYLLRVRIKVKQQ